MHQCNQNGCYAFGVAGLVLSTMAALAATTNQLETTTSLPPILVEASRLDKTSMQMPAMVQVISKEQIRTSGHTTTAEILEKQGGVLTRTLNGSPALAQLSMRGFGENSAGRLLILVNGERLNNPDMSTPNLLRIPVGAITRIEVVRGSQTVLHGDYASAGVINIITDDTYLEPQTTLSGTVGSFGTYAAGINTTGILHDDWLAYSAAFNWDKSNGYRDNSGYQSYNVNSSLRKDFAENRFLSLSTFYHFAEYGLPGSLSREQWQKRPRQTNNPDDRSQLESFGINLGGRLDITADSYLHNNVTISRRKSFSEFRGVSWGAPWRSDYDSWIDSYALLPRYIWDHEIAQLRNILTLGSDLRYDTTGFDSLYATTGYNSLLRWKYQRASMAGYVQDELFLTENLSLTLGGRLEWFHNRVEQVPGNTAFTQRKHALEAALLYRPLDDLKVYAKLGQFYHAPFIDEIFAGAGVPNLKLKPEQGYTLELGTEMQLAEYFNAQLAVYWMEMEREIYYDPTLFQNLNAPDDTRRLGLDAAIGWRKADCGALMLAYHAMQAEFTGGNYDHNRIPLVPRHTVSLQGEYHLFYGISALGGARYVTNQILGSDFHNQAHHLAPYLIFDCGVRYQPTWLPTLTAHLGVDNVFGKQYCDYAGWSDSSGAYYYPARDRFYKLSLNYTF